MSVPSYKVVTRVFVMSVGSGTAGGPGGGGFSGLTNPFRGSEKPDSAGRTLNPGSFSNSPVNGLLYVRGKIGDSSPDFNLINHLS